LAATILRLSRGRCVASLTRTIASRYGRLAMKRFLALGLLLGAAASARADENDLVLARLGTMNSDGSGVTPNNQLFRSLASELGVVFAPRNLAPADTLGFSGFQFYTELSSTTINSSKPYWCATEESKSCEAGFKKSGSIPTFGIFARKGFWFPLPSFEVGAGAVHINSSRLWAGQAYAKFAVHEGFHDWPIPSVAVRGSVARLFGIEQLDLTNASLDLSISKRIAVQGTFSIAPYLGYAFLWIIPRSQVVDKTPLVSIKADLSDLKNNFTFPDQDNIVRHRVFGGFKLKYYVFALVAEVDVALSGSSVDDRAGTTLTCDKATGKDLGQCDAKDQSGTQATYSLALSLDF
jgi:hypothetical protein